jgi:hypothetical protein
VTRVRPGDAEEEDRSDEQFSDEELEVNKFNFAEVIKTRIGGAVAGENEEGRQRRSKTGVRPGAEDVANPGSEHTTATPRARGPRSRETAKGVRSRGRVSEAGVYRFEQKSRQTKILLGSLAARARSKSFGSGCRKKNETNK